jgi:hypothetical protein
MTQFRLSPVRNVVTGEWEYELLDDHAVDFDDAHIVVPRYFSYDGASIPAFAWRLVYTPFDPKVMRAALVHDWLYSNHQVRRKVADKAFRHLLRQSGVPDDKARVMYEAVRLAGDAYWDNDSGDIEYLKALYVRLRGEGAPLDDYQFAPEVIAAAR